MARLCAPARALADVYGLMICECATPVDVTRLTPEQVDAVRVSLDPQHLLPP
ncbi:DUF3717 domain-containing protein [Paraburkholderia sp. J63]|uniref:DUF3717 domain-containing protein n=1 Tax=Paraburkholderia sp. J63 TaxID=2805434 RepID=UPI002ABE5A3D|nr:DUF3717 domain-containing protein [Paraburkholderia sp. J63]